MNRGAERRARVSALVALAGVLAGCQGGGSHTGSGAAVALNGGSVTMAVGSVPTTLNDHTVAGDTADGRAVASLVWAQVFQPGPKLQPVLDTSVVQSAEVVNVSPQTVVYQIDPRATWSDGQAVTAQDFVYSWLSQRGTGQDVDGSADSVASVQGYNDIASVVGSNSGRTVTVSFSSPYADWPGLFDDLLPAHVAERVGWNHGFDAFSPATMLSAGPWMVTAWTPGSRLVLARNPKWWGSRPHLDQIVLQAVAGAPAMVSALRSGAAQVAATSSLDAAVVASASSLPDAGAKFSPGASILQLTYATHHAPLDSAAVRQGIARSIDRDALAEADLQTFVPSAWEENSFLYANMQPPYVDDSPGFHAADPAAAAADFTSGGLTETAGRLTLRGAQVTLRLVWADDDPWSRAVAPVIAADLVDAGFVVMSQPTTSAALTATVLPTGAFDLALTTTPASSYPGVWASSYGTSISAAPYPNWSGFDDPHVDGLFAQAQSQLAADQRQTLYGQIDAALWTAMPVLPLFAEPGMVLWNTSLAGVVDDPGGLGPLWSASQWQLQGSATRLPLTTGRSKSD